MSLSTPLSMQRHGGVLRLRPEKIADYKRLHQAVWPDVLRVIHEAHIRNYSIFLRRLPDGVHYLFSYFEYVGSDFAADMARLAADPVTERWWPSVNPAKIHSPTAPPTNGGPAWKRSFITINVPASARL